MLPPNPSTSFVTLAQLIPLDCAECASYFHRALDYWNCANMQTCTFGELTLQEQAYVREIAHVMERREHPCRHGKETLAEQDATAGGR
jgi:hypothetical protein